MLIPADDRFGAAKIDLPACLSMAPKSMSLSDD